MVVRQIVAVSEYIAVLPWLPFDEALPDFFVHEPNEWLYGGQIFPARKSAQSAVVMDERVASQGPFTCLFSVEMVTALISLRPDEPVIFPTDGSSSWIFGNVYFHLDFSKIHASLPGLILFYSEVVMPNLKRTPVYFDSDGR